MKITLTARSRSSRGARARTSSALVPSTAIAGIPPAVKRAAMYRACSTETQNPSARIALIEAQAQDLRDADGLFGLAYSGLDTAHDMHDYLEGLLQDHGGTMTRGDLLAFAANTDLNLQQIDILGLQQSGVEYI